MELGPLVEAHTPLPLENRLPSRLPIEQALTSGHDVHRKVAPTPLHLAGRAAAGTAAAAGPAAAADSAMA